MLSCLVETALAQSERWFEMRRESCSRGWCGTALRQGELRLPARSPRSIGWKRGMAWSLRTFSSLEGSSATAVRPSFTTTMPLPAREVREEKKEKEEAEEGGTAAPVK